jgi:hypothetical protein
MIPAIIQPRTIRRPPYSYYRYPYSYYGPTYDRTVVRSGIRYYDAYGPRYGGSMYGSDWY